MLSDNKPFKRDLEVVPYMYGGLGDDSLLNHSHACLLNEPDWVSDWTLSSSLSPEISERDCFPKMFQIDAIMNNSNGNRAFGQSSEFARITSRNRQRPSGHGHVNNRSTAPQHPDRFSIPTAFRFDTDQGASGFENPFNSEGDGHPNSSRVRHTTEDHNRMSGFFAGNGHNISFGIDDIRREREEADREIQRLQTRVQDLTLKLNNQVWQHMNHPPPFIPSVPSQTSFVRPPFVGSQVYDNSCHNPPVFGQNTNRTVGNTFSDNFVFPNPPYRYPGQPSAGMQQMLNRTLELGGQPYQRTKIISSKSDVTIISPYQVKGDVRTPRKFVQQYEREIVSQC